METMMQAANDAPLSTERPARATFTERAPRRTPVRRGIAGVLALALAVPLTAAVPTAAPAATLPAAAEAPTTLRHLRLVRSEPFTDSTVTVAPTAVRLWFSQRPELAVTSVRLTNPAGARIATGKGSFGPGQGANAPAVFPITAPLGAGRYTVAWRTMAPDGHVITGEFTFTVAAARGPVGA